MNHQQVSQHHSFDIALAAEYSIEEAILIHHFQHWIRVNRTLKRNQYEGRTWMFQTQEEVAAHFPYFKNRFVVFRIIQKLVDKAVLMEGNFNKSTYDRTKWYAFVDEEKFVPFIDNVHFRTMDREKPHNGLSESERPIPDTKTDTKTDTTAKADSPEQFETNRPRPRSDILFDFDKERFENIETKDIESWKELYPSADIDRELKAMTEWIHSNPHKAKNKKRWRAFINRWLSTTHEKNVNKEANRSRAYSQEIDRRPRDEAGNVKPSQYAGVFQ